MIIKCPNCKNPLRVKKLDKQFICYKCGTIITDGIAIQIGMAKYKFKDDDIEYNVVFESNEHGEEFLDIIEKNSKDYKYCKVMTPLGTVHSLV